MAELNSRKRKLSSQESVIEISDEDACLENSTGSADVEIVEPDSKLIQIDTIPSQSSDSNLDFGTLNSQSSVEILGKEPTTDLKQRLLELDDEIRLLKAENEELRSKPCSCRSRTTDQESVISISFNNSDDFKLYKDQLRKLFEQVLELYVIEQESDLLININRDNDIDPCEWVVIDKDEIKTVNDKPHKKKRKKTKPILKKALKESDSSKDIFILDTTPSISTKNNLKYESKFSVITSANNDDKQNETKNNGASTCFNCNENHNLRDCPKPKDFSKINAARQKFKSQQIKSVRYHLEDDQRFGHLKPGRISDKLQQALGVQNDQLPEYIYRMRLLGYPPGWFNEILAVQQSNLVLFDFEGKGAFNQKRTVQDLDPDKIVEYPGFNVPLEKNVRDESHMYRCPPYSNKYTKEKLLEHVRGMQKKAEDNLESCDMDLDNPVSDKEVEQINSEKQVVVKDSHTSPTLLELESEKIKLLEQLTENTQVEEVKEDTISEELFTTIDVTGTVDQLSETFAESSQENDTMTETNGDDCKSPCPTPNLVKTSSFGTPVLKSASPYCRLPNAENFSKDVSEVINFENLPNSTGKYEQMIGVLDKVRKTLKGIHEQKS